MLDWNDLRYFLAVHRCGTLAAAARELKVDQTTAGRRLSAMEAALDARLFVRHARGFVLTPAGEGILATAERVEDAMLTLERKVEGDDGRLDGVVRITAGEAFAPRLLLPTLPALRRAHPDIRIELLSDLRLYDLARGEADIAIRVGRPEQEHLVSKRVGEMAFAMYASVDYLARAGTPRTLLDLEGHDIVGYDASLAFMPAVRWLENVTPAGRYTFRANTTLAVAGAASLGLGLTVLPCLVGETEPGLRRVAAPEIVASQTVWLVVHEDLQRIARIRAVVRHVTDAFRSAAPLLAGERSAV